MMNRSENIVEITYSCLFTSRVSELNGCRSSSERILRSKKLDRVRQKQVSYRRSNNALINNCDGLPCVLASIEGEDLSFPLL